MGKTGDTKQNRQHFKNRRLNLPLSVQVRSKCLVLTIFVEESSNTS